MDSTYVLQTDKLSGTQLTGVTRNTVNYLSRVSENATVQASCGKQFMGFMQSSL